MPRCRDQAVTMLDDLYCERTAPGLWAEPLNALTNLAFFAAACVAWRLARRHDELEAGTVALIVLMASIGVGSTLFHTFATPWARVLDVLPIMAYQLLFLGLYLRRVVGTRSALAVLAAAGLLVASALARAAIDPQWSVQYLPSLGVLLGLGVYHLRAGKPAPWGLLAAVGALLLGLLFRTLDQPACDHIAVGTHFLWHVLAAVAVLLVFRVLVSHARAERAATESIGSGR